LASSSCARTRSRTPGCFGTSTFLPRGFRGLTGFGAASSSSAGTSGSTVGGTCGSAALFTGVLRNGLLVLGGLALRDGRVADLIFVAVAGCAPGLAFALAAGFTLDFAFATGLAFETGLTFVLDAGFARGLARVPDADFVPDLVPGLAALGLAVLAAGFALAAPFFGAAFFLAGAFR
jgi:hypothetical protein